MRHMMSAGGYLNDIVRGPWRPHVMIGIADTPVIVNVSVGYVFQ